MIKITTWFVFTSIMAATAMATGCGDKMITLDPNMGNYSKSGCENLREDGNIVCRLTPLADQTEDCYHMECQWKEQEDYILSWSISHPYDTIVVEMKPEFDISPEMSLFFTLILLALCLPMACAHPEIAVIAFMNSGRTDTRYGRSSRRG
jgi:hypothetical protein